MHSRYEKQIFRYFLHIWQHTDVSFGAIVNFVYLYPSLPFFLNLLGLLWYMCYTATQRIGVFCKGCHFKANLLQESAYSTKHRFQNTRPQLERQVCQDMSGSFSSLCLRPDEQSGVCTKGSWCSITSKETIDIDKWQGIRPKRISVCQCDCMCNAL